MIRSEWVQFYLQGQTDSCHHAGGKKTNHHCYSWWKYWGPERIPRYLNSVKSTEINRGEYESGKYCRNQRFMMRYLSMWAALLVSRVEHERTAWQRFRCLIIREKQRAPTSANLLKRNLQTGHVFSLKLSQSVPHISMETRMIVISD